MLKLSLLKKEVANSLCAISKGCVLGIQGPIILAKIPQTSLGDFCSVQIQNAEPIICKVVSFHDDLTYLAAYADLKGVFPGAQVKRLGNMLPINIPACCGIVIDALGKPLIPFDENARSNLAEINLFSSAPAALDRKPICSQIQTGIRSLDALCSIGHGQRIGLFAGAGVGKSTLLGMIAKNSDIDVNVIALIGERGREVNEFLNKCLGTDGLKKSLVVVSTSEQPPALRSLAASTATAIAEYYRSKGKKVLLLLDSLTRTARAMRDISLASGELPIRQGITTSVYNELSKLVERAGNDACGSITAIYTLLDSSEHEPDPLAEEIKSLLDGHICLTSDIASSGIRPAIDYTRSISRLMNSLHDNSYLDHAQAILRIIYRLRKDKELLLMGGAADAELSRCLAIEKDLNKFLQQPIESKSQLQESIRECMQLAKQFHNTAATD